MKEFPIKFLSLRDRNASHRRSNSVPAGTKESKSRPLSAEAFRAMFKMDGSRRQEAEADAAKVEEVQQRLERLDITNVAADHIRDILATEYADGDPAKAADFIDLEQKALAGVVVSHDPSVALVGAENRQGVTCYLDALLFAMFCKLDAFECMLTNELPPDDPRCELANLLRMWVNMLRSGRLIHTDLTKLMQDALGDCGWPDARLLEQQDTSEAFVFLTETLQLPLLSLQVDLFHQGKKDKDDHKVVYERLLNLAVPPDPEGKGVKLEDCLEEYFNARVDVLRDSEEAKKSTMEDKVPDQSSAFVHQDTARLLIDDEAATPTQMMTASPSTMSPSTLDFRDAREDTGSCVPTDDARAAGTLPQNGAPERDEDAEAGGSQRRPPTREPSTGVIRRVLVDEQGRPAGDLSSLQRARRKGSNVIKAVTIPAWQFFRLIPWHALTSTEPQNDTEVAMNFDQRPIVGICLKRYGVNESGQPQRINTFIDIPDSLRLPHFMLASGPELEEENGLSTEYKLVLQSVVCHRGDSVQSGHYIAYARVAPKLLTGNRKHDFDPPPDYEEAQWVQFDDLEARNRVTFVDDIKRSLRDEMPYLLFYQVVPMVDITCPSTAGTETEPPSYNQSRKSFEMASSGSLCDGDVNGSGRNVGHAQDEAVAVEPPSRSKPPSIRLSSEAERLPRPIFDSNWTGWNAGSTADSRRPSIVCADAEAVAPAVVLGNSEAVTPAMTPGASSPVFSPSDEPTGSRLSRAASRFTLGRQSRSASQSGEGRLSFSMTRLGGLMKTSREPLVDSNGLALSISGSGGPPSLDAHGKTPDSPLDGEKSPAHPLATPLKHKHGKSKDKAKHKPDGSQPERECSVM